MATRFIVTAGPTREYLDPVRYITNPSSGRQGFAVARAAARAGCAVTLIAGPVRQNTPAGVRRCDVVSACQMCAAVLAALRESAQAGEDVALVMTAAVADYRPKVVSTRKLKKGGTCRMLKLVANPDILKTVKAARHAAPEQFPKRFVRVGFAAETGAPEAEAARKCRAKELDLTVGNDVTAAGCGFGTVTNRVTFVRAEGTIEKLPMMRKDAIARRIVRFCLENLQARGGCA